MNTTVYTLYGIFYNRFYKHFKVQPLKTLDFSREFQIWGFDADLDLSGGFRHWITW